MKNYNIPFELGQSVFYTFGTKTIYTGVIITIKLTNDEIIFGMYNDKRHRYSDVYYPPVHIDNNIKPINLYNNVDDAINACLEWSRKKGMSINKEDIDTDEY